MYTYIVENNTLIQQAKAYYIFYKYCESAGGYLVPPYKYLNKSR